MAKRYEDERQSKSEKKDEAEEDLADLKKFETWHPDSRDDLEARLQRLGLGEGFRSFQKKPSSQATDFKKVKGSKSEAAMYHGDLKKKRHDDVPAPPIKPLGKLDKYKRGKSYRDITSAPQCLVSTGIGNDVNAEEDVLRALLQRDKPAVIVGIAGKYRSGKSYLMNRLAGKSGGFSLGSTIQSQTKGIWMWVTEHPLDPNVDLILLDTEGLGDVEKSNANHDIWIFCLTLLLSSTLVFNVMGVLDQGNIDMLNLILELSQRIKTKEGRKLGEDLDFDAYCPYFVMAHRDFTQELEANGKRLTQDGYLEHCLQLSPEKDGERNRTNEARQHIRKYFKKRCCFVFRQPTRWDKLKNLENIPDGDLDEAFVEESTRFIEFIYNECEVKTFQNGKPVSGRILAEMTRIYVDSIKRGDIPCIEGALGQIAIEEDNRVMEQAVKIFHEHVKMVTLPVELNDLEAAVVAARHKALEYFENNVIRDQNEELTKRIVGTLENLSNGLAEKNMRISEEKCKALLEKYGNMMEYKIRNNMYFKQDGNVEYLEDQSEVRRKYDQETELGQMKLPALDEFLRTKEVIFAMVKDYASKEVVHKLAQEKRDLELEMMKTNYEKRELQLQMEHKEKLDAQEKQMVEMAQQNAMEKLEAKMKEMVEANARLMEERLQHQKEKNQEGLIADLDKIKHKKMKGDDKRQEGIDRRRGVEINRLSEEGKTRLAHQQQKEKERLSQEYTQNREAKNGWWTRMKKYIWS